MHGKRLVSQSNKKKTSMLCSTSEAEYVAVGRCCAYILLIKNHLLDYGLNFSKTPFRCDNTDAIRMIHNPVMYSKTKHIDICHHFIRGIVHKGKMELFYIPYTGQLAGILTKPLDEKSLNKLTADLEMLSIT